MITYGIIVATAIVSILSFSRRDRFYAMAMDPQCILQKGEYHRLLTYALVHADWAHLIFNMLTLFFFGPNVEEVFVAFAGKKGAMLFLLLYVTGTVVSTLFSLFKHRNDSRYIAVGASGAVSAVLFAFILMSPTSSLYLFLLPIPIPAFIFGGIYLAASFYLGRRQVGNIGHDAHFWGAVYGFVFTLFAFPLFLDSFLLSVANWF